MKFRIMRCYKGFQPQVLEGAHFKEWINIGSAIYDTVDEAKEVCRIFKEIRENPIVEEFEL